MFLNLTKNLFDKENSEKLSQLSKRIKKDPKQCLNLKKYQDDKAFKNRSIFQDITNKAATKSSFTNTLKDQIKANNTQKRRIMNHNVYLEDTFAYDEDSKRPSTTKFTTLSFVNKTSKRLFKFYCFNDQELKFPNAFSGKSINHNIDNDCSTDDQQIKGAIIKLYKNLDGGVKDIKDFKKMYGC